MNWNEYTSWIILFAAVCPVVIYISWRWRFDRSEKWGPEACSPKPLVLPEATILPPPCSRTVAGYVQHFDRFQLADNIKLLVDGRQAYPEMLQAIDNARKTVDFETYIFCPDRTGRRFQEALIRAAKRGVKVRLLYDYIGSFGIPNLFIREMLKAGIKVSVYHPLILTRPIWALNRRDHRKMLIVDNRISFTGGLNIGDDYASRENGGRGWRDTHVRIEGQVVAEWVELLFDYGWNNSVPFHETSQGGSKLRDRVRRRLKKPITLRSLSGGHTSILSSLCKEGKIPVQVIGNKEFRNRRRIHRAYIHAINQAKRYVLIENGYFIPDHHIRKALAQAVQRGVVVAVVVAKHSDVRAVSLASRFLYRTLLESGVRIYEWPGVMMHAKTAVIDDVWAVVGSYNMDHRSLFHQLESVAVVADSHFAVQLRQQTMKDISECQEGTLKRHCRRPLPTKILELAAYSIKNWL